MRFLGVCLVLLLLVPTGSAASDSVVVVLDSSAPMWKALDDGLPRFVAARLALGDWQAELGTDIAVGLRLMGGERPASDLASCQDNLQALPVERSHHMGWQQALDGVRPAGARPLLASVSTAISDLGDADGQRRVVILTAGDDECNGSSEAIESALADAIQFRLIGLGMSPEAVERFGAIVPTRNPGSTNDLLAALRWAVEDLVVEPRVTTGEFRAEVQGLAAITTARLLRKLGGDVFDLAVDGNVIQGLATPGVYSLLLEDDINGTVDSDDVTIRPGDRTVVEIRPVPPVVMAMEVIPTTAIAGADVSISLVGAPPGEHWVSLAPAGHESGSWVVRTRATGPDDHVLLRSPDQPGEYEIRFHETIGSELERVATTVNLSVDPSEVNLDIPSEAGHFEELTVNWSGPNRPEDYLAFGLAGSPASRFGSCVSASAGGPAQMTSPGVAGRWEIRYVSGLSGTILAGEEIDINEASVTLTTPARIGLGEAFDVDWEGPAADADYIAIYLPESSGDDYLSLHLAEVGSPATMIAPTTAGSYEIRYMNGRDNRIFKRVSLVVETAPVTLEAPARVLFGTRFNVIWTGPDLMGDFIAIALPDAHPGRHLDWSFTSSGSPASLAAPFNPGPYEIRYIKGDRRKILTSIPITVEE